MKINRLPQMYGKNAVQVVERRPLYRGFFAMESVQFRYPHFDGSQSELVTREVFERGDAVVVLPYDPEQDKVVLIEQLRIPALRTSETPWLMELVAGIIEEGESPEAVARRELMEESGLEARQLTQLCSFLSSPGGTSERLTLFLAEVALPEGIGEGLFGLDEEHEDIRRHVVSREQAMAWIDSGVIDNASTIIGLQWLQLHHKDPYRGLGD